MTCLLRISGDSLNVDALLAGHSLPTDRTWRKGDAKSQRGDVYSTSGVQLLVSDTALDQLVRQAEEATAFLETHRLDIKRMVAFPGVLDAALDFGIVLPEGYVAQFSYLPPRLIQLAAEAGLGIYLSHYACGDGDEG